MEKRYLSREQRIGIIAGAILAPALAISLWLFQANPPAPNPPPSNPVLPNTQNSPTYQRLHGTSFFEKLSFYPAIEAVDTSPIFTINKPIYGATVPHHLIPSPAIASLFHELKKQDPKTIILLSPNHFNAGTKTFLTSNYAYPTPFGNLTTDNTLYQKLLSIKETRSTLFEENHTALNNDHGIGALAPFITYYLPDTTIIPILIRDGSSERDMEQLSNILAPFISTSTPLITSVDFSHYLSLQEANKKDITTMDAIMHLNLKALIHLDSNDYLDTPIGVATLLSIMKRNGTATMTQRYHDNSGNILHEPHIPSTSYFILTFTK